MPLPPRSYEETCRVFRWRIPDIVNIAVEAIDRQASGGADGHRTALIAESDLGVAARYTFIDLQRYSNRLAHLLTDAGIGPGERVAIIMGPSGEAAVALLAALKVGAIAVPLSPRLEPLALLDRFQRLEVAAALGERALAPLLATARANLPSLRLALAAHASAENVAEMWTSLIPVTNDFEPVQTAADEPALLLHHAGENRATLYAHRVLHTRLPGVEFAHRGFPHVGDIMWTAADWASEGGWLDCVLPAWWHGVTVVASPARADNLPGLLARWGVRNIHLPAHRLDALRETVGSGLPPLRSLVVTGELSLDDAAWLRDHCGGAVARALGNAALGLLVAPSPLFDCPAEALGRPAPGYTIDVVDQRGRILPADAVGDIALHLDSPSLPLGTLDGDPLPHLGRWMPVAQKARKDLDGTFWPDPPRVLPAAPEPEKPFTLRALDPDERWR